VKKRPITLGNRPSLNPLPPGGTASHLISLDMFLGGMAVTGPFHST